MTIEIAMSEPAELMTVSDTTRNAEKIVLGSSMESVEQLNAIRDIVEPGDFSDPRDGDIFRHICLHVDRGGPCEPNAILASLLDIKVVMPSNGYIAELWLMRQSQVTWYARRIAEASAARKAHDVGLRIVHAARKGDVGAVERIVLRSAAAYRPSEDRRQDDTPTGLGATPTVAGHGYARRFPVNCLPAPMRDYVLDIANRVQVPVDLPALVALGIEGSVAGPRITVRQSRELRQPTNIYVAPSMGVSTRKSPVFAELIAGVRRAEEVMTEQRRVAHAERIAGLKHQAERLYMDANAEANEVRREAIRAEAKESEAAAAELESAEVRRAIGYLDGDTTVEALAISMAENDGSGPLIDDEGTFFRNLAGLYNGGNTANLGLVLCGYDSRYYRPKRVSRNSVPIERASLSLVLSPQPAILASVLADSMMDDAGFVHRFIIAVPGDLVGQMEYRAPTYIDDEPESQASVKGRAWWATLLCDIARYPVIESADDVENRATIDLTREAFKVSYEYGHELDRRLHPKTGDLATYKPWVGKHASRVLRIAALLHLAAGGTPDDRIAEGTMLDAVEIGNWAIEHYLKAGAAAGLSPDADRIREFVDNSEFGFVPRKDIYEKVFNRNQGKDRIEKWIAELVATGNYAIREVRSGRGRPPKYLCRAGVDVAMVVGSQG